MLEINRTWTSTGSSGGLEAVYLGGGAELSALYCEFSTLATTNSVSFQTAHTSSGPWVSESSAAISTALNGVVVLRLTGPYLWMRPFIHTASTGSYVFRLIANAAV